MNRNILALVILNLLFTACRAAPTPASQATPGKASLANPAVVTFMVPGDPAELAAYQKLVKAFEQAHSDIAIELIHIPSQSDYRQRLVADFAAGTPADVVLLNYRRYAAFAVKGVLEPLGPYVAQSTLIHEDDFYAEAIAPFRWGRQVMCLPQNISSLAVYYNQDLFAAAGLAEPHAKWTRDEFLQAAIALTRDTNGDGQVDQYGLGIEPSLIRAAPFIWQEKGALVDRPYMPQRLALDSPEALKALQWFVDLQVTYQVVPDAEAEAAEDSQSRFMNGRTAMYVDSRRAVPTFRAITAFTWDVAALPRHKGRRPNILHADGYCLTAAARHKAAAWAFIEFANSPAGQAVVAETGRTVPSLKAVAESPAFLDPNALPAHSRVWLDSIPSLRPVPVLKNWADIETIAGDEIERAFYGQASVLEAVRSAIARTEDYFKQ